MDNSIYFKVGNYRVDRNEKFFLKYYNSDEELELHVIQMNLLKTFKISIN